MNLKAEIIMCLLRWIFQTDNPPNICFGIPEVGTVYGNQDTIDKFRTKYNLWYHPLIFDPKTGKWGEDIGRDI